MALDINKLFKPYRPKRYPTIEGGVPNFTTDELEKLATAMDGIRKILLDHEERLVGGGL
jgi:hypothetical protein